MELEFIECFSAGDCCDALSCTADQAPADNASGMIVDVEESLDAAVEAMRSEFRAYAFLRPVRRRVRSLLLPFQKDARVTKGRKKSIVIDDAVEAEGVAFETVEEIAEDAEITEALVEQQPIEAQKAQSAGALFAVGDIVEVARRMWPGINKPGGTARVTGMTEDETDTPLYDVRYTVVGGSERGVEERYLKQSGHSSLDHQSRKSSLMGRCRVEHCPCFIKDCAHIQPGEPGYADPHLFAPPPDRRGSGGAIISLLKSKIVKINRTIASNLKEMMRDEEGLLLGRGKKTGPAAKVRRCKKAAEPTKGAGKETVRERIDIFAGSKHAARALCSLANITVPVAAAPSVAAAELYRKVVELYEVGQPESAFIQPEGLSQAERLPYDIMSNDSLQSLKALGSDSLLDLVLLLNSQLATAIGNIAAVKRRAAALRDTLLRSSYSPRAGLSAGGDIIAAAMSVLTVTDDFDDLDVRTTRLVQDVFNQVHRLLRRERKASLTKAQRQRWALLERRNGNLAEEWRDERAGCLDCIKALHRRFEADFGICAEDALDDDPEDSCDDDSDYDETDWLQRVRGASTAPRRQRAVKSAEEQAMDGPARGSSLLADRERFRRRQESERRRGSVGRRGDTYNDDNNEENNGNFEDDDNNENNDDNNNDSYIHVGRIRSSGDGSGSSRGFSGSTSGRADIGRTTGSRGERRSQNPNPNLNPKPIRDRAGEGREGSDESSTLLGGGSSVNGAAQRAEPESGAPPAADGSTVVRFLRAVCSGAALLSFYKPPSLPDSSGSIDLMTSMWYDCGAVPTPLVREVISAAVADYKRTGRATPQLSSALFGPQGLLLSPLPQIAQHRQEILLCFLDRGERFEEVYIFGGCVATGAGSYTACMSCIFDRMKRESFSYGAAASCIAAMDYLMHRSICLRQLATAEPQLLDTCKKQLERTLQQAMWAALSHAEAAPAMMELLLSGKGSVAGRSHGGGPYMGLLLLWRLTLGLLIELDGQYAKRSWRLIDECLTRHRASPSGALVVGLATSESRTRASASGVLSLLVVHTFLLRHTRVDQSSSSQTVPHNWPAVQRFCLSGMLPAENSVSWQWEGRLQDFLDKIAALGRLWDLPSEGLASILDLVAAHARWLQLEHRSCRYHGCRACSGDTQPFPSVDASFEQHALMLQLQESAVLSYEDVLECTVQQLFRSCQLGSLDSSGVKCECGFSWGAMLAIRRGLRLFLHESCRAEGPEGMTRRRLKIALTRQEGLLRLVASSGDVPNSFFQWSLLGLLAQEAYRWSGDPALFDETKNSDSVSALSNNRLVRAVLTETNLSPVQQACIMWQLVAAGGAPASGKRSCTLLELFRAEICRCAVEVGMTADDTQPIILATSSSALGPRQPFSPLARRLITASLCAASLLLYHLKTQSSCSHDLLLAVLRCHAGLGVLASHRLLGPPRGTIAVAACISLSNTFKCALQLVELDSHLRFLQRPTEPAAPIENINPNTAAATKDTGSILSWLLQALLQQAIPQVRSAVQVLQSLGLEYAPSFHLSGAAADPLARCLLACSEGLGWLFAALCLLELRCRAGMAQPHDRKQLAPQLVLRLASELLDNGLRSSDSPLRTWLYCAFYNPIITCAASRGVTGAYCVELLLEQPWLLEKLCMEVLVTVAGSCLAQPTVGAQVGLFAVRNALCSLASNAVPMSAPVAAVCSALRASDREQSPKDMLACIFAAIGSLRVSLPGEQLRRLRQGLRLGAGEGGARRTQGVCLSDVVVRLTRYISLCAFRVSERSRFDLMLSTHFLQSLLMSTVICVAGGGSSTSSAAAATSLFERHDLSDAAHSTVIGEFVGNNAKIASRTMVLQARGRGSSVSVHALQETSLFISHLPLYVKCIPSVAFSTRQLQWECLLELFITAWGCHCNPLGGHASDEGVSMELKVVVAWSLALSAPSVGTQGGSYTRLIASCPAAVAGALRPVIRALEMVDRLAIVAVEQDDCRIHQLRQYLLLFDKAWNGSSASLTREGGSSLTNALRPLASAAGALSSRVALAIFTAFFARKLGLSTGHTTPAAGEGSNLVACCALLAVRMLRVACRDPFFLVDPSQLATSTAEGAVRTYIQQLFMALQAGVLPASGVQDTLLRSLLEGCCICLVEGASGVDVASVEVAASNLLHCLCEECNCPLYCLSAVKDGPKRGEGVEVCCSQSCQLCHGGALLRELRGQLLALRSRSGGCEISSLFLKSSADRATVESMLAVIRD